MCFGSKSLECLESRGKLLLLGRGFILSCFLIKILIHLRVCLQLGSHTPDSSNACIIVEGLNVSSLILFKSQKKEVNKRGLDCGEPG